jgi:hypothetical protein
MGRTGGEMKHLDVEDLIEADRLKESDDRRKKLAERDAPYIERLGCYMRQTIGCVDVRLS